MNIGASDKWLLEELTGNTKFAEYVTQDFQDRGLATLKALRVGRVASHSFSELMGCEVGN